MANPEGFFQPGNHHSDEGRRGAPMPAVNKDAILQRKREMIRLLLEGYKMKEISQALGVSLVTLCNYVKDPQVRTEIAELSTQLLGELDTELLSRIHSKTEIIDELATIALGEMRKILTDPNAHIGVKSKMIDSALDRCSEVSRTKKLDVTARVLSIKAEDLLHAARTAVEV